MEQIELSSAPVTVAHVEAKITTKDNIELFTRTWDTVSKHRATIILIHGLAEHCGRYDAVARQFNQSGFIVHSMDLRGHGKSKGTPVFVKKFEDYLHDVDALFDSVAKKNYTVPTFILGHSMGGCLSSLYTIKRLSERKDVPVTGLILSSPALLLGDDVTPCMIGLAKLIAAIAPKMPIQAIDATSLSRNPEIVQANIHDPLVYHGKISARMGTQLAAGMELVQNGRKSITLPVYIFHGTEDKLTAINGSKELYANMGSTDKTLKIWEGYYHETMNDVGRESVIEGVLDWIEAHMVGATPVVEEKVEIIATQPIVAVEEVKPVVVVQEPVVEKTEAVEPVVEAVVVQEPVVEAPVEVKENEQLTAVSLDE